MILDAAKSAMSSQINDHRDDDVRRFLEPMSVIADRLDVVFLALVHFGKRAGTDTGALILGSIAWSQVARSVLSVARDEEDGTLVDTNTKGNLAPRTLSREARIISTPVTLDDGTTTPVGRVEWGQETTRDARDFLAARDDDEDASDRTAAADWLEDYLRINPGSPSQAVKTEARKAGHSERTVKRAMKALGVVVASEGFPRRTVWSLPNVASRASQDTLTPRAHEAGPTGPTVDDLHKQDGPTGDKSTVGPPTCTRAPLAQPGTNQPETKVPNLAEGAEDARARVREPSESSGTMDTNPLPNLALATDPGTGAAHHREAFITEARAAIEPLRGKDRTTAQAHYFRLARDKHHMTNRAIAEAFGVSNGTVGNRIIGRSDRREDQAS